MADELELDLEQLDANINNQNKVEKRIKDLSQKVELTSQERDELKRLNEEKDVQLASKEKEIEFLSSFSQVSAKFPGAAEHRDSIKEKVLKGYSVEDATLSVLNAEGKLGAAIPATPPPSAAEVAGGSAVTQMQGATNKSLQEMTREEKRSQLEEAVARGDISLG